MTVIDRLGCGCPRAGYATRKAGGYVVNRSTYLPTCMLGAHAHEEDRVVLTASGEFGSTYGNRAFALDAFRAIYRPAYLEHRDRYHRETACITIRLPRSDAPPASAFAFADCDLPSAARRLWAEFDADDSASELAIESLSGEIIARVSAEANCKEARPQWVRRIRDRIEDEFGNPPTLRAIAREVERDSCHVAATFRRVYGKSVGEYVRDVRIWRTRALLEDASIPLAEVAASGGFADQSHFTRLFKHRFSMTPGQYRRRLPRRSLSRAEPRSSG